MTLDTIDISALRTLCAVYDQGSFSRAAVQLGRSQSSVSYVIGGLRKALDDPLFVRQGHGIAPTPRCEALLQTARDFILRFEQLSDAPAFDPASSSAEVRISCNYYERVTVLPELVRTLRQTAPAIRLRLIQSFGDGADHIRKGLCDILVSPVQTDAPDIWARPLFGDAYVVVADAENPIMAQDLTMAAYAAAPHVLVDYGGNWRSFYLRELDRQGIALNTLVAVPSPASLEELVVGTDLISTVPKRIADRFSGAIAQRRSPCPAPFEISLYWSLRTHQAPLFRWVRRQIEDVVAAGLR